MSKVETISHAKVASTNEFKTGKGNSDSQKPDTISIPDMLKTGTLNAKENSHIGVEYKGLDKILCSGLSEEEFMKAEEKTLKSVHGGEDISSRLKFAKDLFAAIDKDGNKTLDESDIRNVKSKKLSNTCRAVCCSLAALLGYAAIAKTSAIGVFVGGAFATLTALAVFAGICLLCLALLGHCCG